MSQSRFGIRRGSTSGMVHFFTMVNLALSFGVLAAWPSYSEALADPVSVISGGAPPIRPSAFEYPYMLLWLLPLSGIGGAYIAKAMDLEQLAKFFAIYPVLLTITSCIWLYFYAGYWS